MAARQPQYSPKQIADAMQVSESSVKRWCDRDVIPSIRTIGGHRRITLDGLSQFLRSSGRQLLHPERLGLPQLPPDRETKIARAEDPQQQRFRGALAAGDENECRSILRQRIASGWTRSEAAEDLIRDAMHGFGEAWDCQQLDIYQERRGCDIALRLIYELRMELRDAAHDAPIAIGGAPEGDPYQLPTALVELALREIGWQATSLGGNLPLASFVQAAHDYQPQLIWLSVSAIDNPAEFVAAENELAEAIGEQVPLLVGGRALTDEIRPKLRYTAHCDSLRHLAELASMIGQHQAGGRRPVG